MLRGMWQRFSRDEQLPRALARSFSGFYAQEVLWSWMVRGRRGIPGRQGVQTSLLAATAWDRGEEDTNSQPVSILEGGDDHKCDYSCIYLGLLVQKTRVIIPVLVRAGFLSSGTKGEVGSPRQLGLCSVMLRHLPRALTFCL